MRVQRQESEDSELSEFEVKVGMHQVTVMPLFLFVVVVGGVDKLPQMPLDDPQRC